MLATRPITKLEPLDCWITPASVVVSTPSSLAICSAWATSWMLAAKSALFTSFTASAVPSAPIVKIGSAYAATVVARALDVVRRAAHHDRERAREHVVGATAERRVDHVPVTGGGDPLDGRRAAGRVRDEERVVAEVRDQAVVGERDLLELLVGVHRDVHGLGAASGLGQGVGHVSARPVEVLAHLGPAGVHGDVVSGREQPLRHGRADLAGADEADPHR